MLKWPIRLASVLAAAVLAYGWGDWAADRSVTGAIILGVLTVVLAVALGRLYRTGGLAAFDFDDDVRMAPGEAVASPSPGPPPQPRTPQPRPQPPRREPRESRGGGLFGRRAATPAEPQPAQPARPSPPPTPPRSRRQGGGGSLWSSDRAPEPSRGAPAPAPAPAAGAIDLNAATVDQLAMLPGIGRGAAARIVAHRDERGPFASVNGLADVEGFDAGRVNRVAGRLRV